MIHVIANIEVAAGKREELLAVFQPLIPQVRAEAGCIEYGTAVDAVSNIPVQIPIRPHVVTVVEKWADLDALLAHLATPHMQTYRERVKDIVKGVQLQILEPA
jgi:quinol monooxygenase YgiN